MQNKILVEGKHGHGGLKNKVDFRDQKLAMASIPFDWEKGYDVEQELQTFLGDPLFRIPVKDQGVSSSCCGQAGSYYEEIQDTFEKGYFLEKSARDVYSQIYYSGGGSTTRDVLNLLTSKGNCKESLLSSYEMGQPPKEAFMRTRTSAGVTDALTARGTAYGSFSKNMDEIAAKIRDNHGIIMGVDGQNNGTWLSAFPKPPETVEWGHELYVGRAKIINGKKYIGVLNSWGTDVGERGWQWLGEEYLPFMHSFGALYDSTNDALKAEKSLLEQILALLQELFTRMTGADSKKIIN